MCVLVCDPEKGADTWKVNTLLLCYLTFHYDCEGLFTCSHCTERIPDSQSCAPVKMLVLAFASMCVEPITKTPMGNPWGMV